MSSIDTFNKNCPLLIDPTFFGEAIHGRLENSPEGDYVKLSKIVSVGTILITTVNSQYRYSFTNRLCADYFFEKVTQFRKEELIL